MHAIYVFFLCLFSACTRTSVGLVPSYCLRPEHRAVTTEQQAILAARSAWYCIHSRDEQESEQAWLKDFAAARQGPNWDVTTRRPEGGPIVAVQLAAADGRVLDVKISQ
jgi:hypothetical protein